MSKQGSRDSVVRFVPQSLRSWRSSGILLPFSLLFVVLSFSSGAFLNPTNLLNILDQQSAFLIIAAAGTLVLVTGGIDLSVGATYALASCVSAQYAEKHSILASVILGIVLGLVVGIINGIIVAYLKINPLIATLAMSFVIGGLGSKFTKGNLIVLTDKPEYGKIAQTVWLGVNTSIWIMAVIVVLLGILLTRTVIGRYMIAAGGNAQAARLAGIQVNRVRIIAFALSGAAAAVAGIIDASRVLSASAALGSTLAFTVLAGIVVGGTSIAGGDGSVWLTVLGVLFIALIGNGFDLLGIDPLYQQITLGLILLVAVGMDAYGRSHQR
ncbi:MAG TPA: ABC transporter permease [Candidatus Nanopelagicaceae bacterium]